MGHEAVRSRAMPVLLARLEEDAVAGADLLDRAAAALAEADALGDPDRLAVRVRMPCRSCAGREMDAARAQARAVRRRRDCVDEDCTGEPVARPGRGLDAVPGDLHGQRGTSLSVVARTSGLTIGSTWSAGQRPPYFERYAASTSSSTSPASTNATS